MTLSRSECAPDEWHHPADTCHLQSTESTMRHIRPRVQERLSNQMQSAFAGLLRKAGSSLSGDGVEVRPGRFFSVQSSCERMEFGNDREGDLGRDRPALLIKRWKTDIWLALPGSLREPYPGTETLSFRVASTDWAYRAETDVVPDCFLFFWYERLLCDFLKGHRSDLRQECLQNLKSWLQDHHSASAFRCAELAGDWGTLQ